MVSYTYDACGKMISKTGTLATTLGTLQPFRYRGYIFDEETGLYYLRSRYYNPNLCRFINADDGEAYVDAITTKQFEEPVKVYNFEVEDFHTYFVGTGCILVHNMCAKVSNHGNSLNITKPAKGYILKERGTGKIMKFGETTLGKRRYTVKFLDANKVDMVFVKSGTNRAMHTWQKDMIVNYAKRHGVRPPMNHNWY